MITLSVQINHLASAAVFLDNQLIYFQQEERLSKNKGAGSIPFFVLDDIKKRVGQIDNLVSTGYNFAGSEELKHYVEHIDLFKDRKKSQLNHYFKSHHLAHAFKAVVSSNFKEGLVFVVDGRGCSYNLSNGQVGYETASVYKFKDNNLRCLHKYVYTNAEDVKDLKVKPEVDSVLFALKGVDRLPFEIDENTKFTLSNELGMGEIYSHMSTICGFDNEEGKLMGLAAYGQYDEELYNRIKNFDKDYFKFKGDSMLGNGLIKSNLKYNDYLNIAFNTQKFFEDEQIKLLNKHIDNETNIVLTGGCALNVVNNYKLKKVFQSKNFYAEPMCGDEGNSIGIGQYEILRHGYKPQPIDNICLGNRYNYSNINGVDVQIDQVVNLIKEGHIIALYQGGCEAGPRALGNRSLLLDPTIHNGKDIMNTVKQREKFRPFACSILHEDVNDWFDMAGINESPFMMYGVESKQEDKIKSVIHEDKTCRVQTVKSSQNQVLYDILKEFKNKTGIPLLMNTSFNLAGETLVETPEDAIDVLKRSKLEYVYFADIKKLVYIKNNE